VRDHLTNQARIRQTDIVYEVAPYRSRTRSRVGADVRLHTRDIVPPKRALDLLEMRQLCRCGCRAASSSSVHLLWI